MKNLMSVLVCLSLAVSGVGPAAMAQYGEPVPRSLIRVYVEDRAGLRQVGDMGLISACGYSAGDGYIDVIALPYERERLRATRFHMEVLEENIDRRLEPYRRAQDLGVYHSVAETDAELRLIHEDYPAITHLESIGKSWEDRDIWALKISDNPAVNEDEPSVMYNGAHHAREWISYEVPLALANHLVSGYGADETITALVDEREIWIVPIVNPDGVHYSQTEYTMWRKNRRKNEENPGRWWGNGSKDGVDPNRNYGYMWGTTGASDYIGSDTYHGPGPFSEPETVAVRDFAVRENFDATISFHSYSELVLYPFGYAYDAHAPDEDALKKIAVAMASFTGYTPQKITDLYACMGTSDDWLYGEAGAFAFTIELGTWFVPDDEEVEPICRSNIESCMYLLERAGNLVDERVALIADVQGYIGSLVKSASGAGRSLYPDEQREYMRMIKLRNTLRAALVREITASGGGKLRCLVSALEKIAPPVRMIFRPVLNDLAAAFKTTGRRLHRDTERELEELFR